jgi:hypothetical protein
MKKRKLILICVTAFIACVFIACANEGDISTLDNNQPINPDQNQTPDGAGADLAETSEFVPVAGLDYQEHRFRILGYDGQASGTWQIAGISEIIAEEATGDPINDAIYNRNLAVEELYNIKIDIVPILYPDRAAFAEIFRTSVLAGDDHFDAAFMIGSSLPTIISTQNMAHNLSEIPALDLSKSWWDQNSVNAMSIGGRLSAVIGDMNLYSAIAPMAVFANKRLMQEEGVEDLYQLVREGKWTWDVLGRIARDATRDLNGDNFIDTADQIGLVTQYVAFQQAINSAGEVLTPKNNEDIPEFLPNMERLAGITEKVSGIFNDRAAAIVGDNITGYNNVWFDLIMPKFLQNEIMFTTFQLLFSFELRGMEADFAILPFPKYDENQQNYNSSMSRYWSKFTVIPITNQNLDRTANILQAMGYYSQQLIMPAYYNVTLTHKLVRDNDSAEMLDIILGNRIIDLAELYNWGSINGVLYEVGQNGGIVSRLERVEGTVVRGLEQTLSELGIH